TYFSMFGQCVILALIQLGGLGLVTFATFFNIAIRKKIGLKNMNLAKESVNSDSAYDVAHLIKMIFAITIIIEVLGALSLATVFIPEYGIDGMFISLFLAVSAYCNAGFDILGFKGEYSSLTTYSDNPTVLITIALLIICGGLGFIVWQDLYAARKTKRLTLHSKIVIWVTVTLIVAGAICFAIFEWNNNGTIGKMSVGDKVLNSFFMSVTARTAGFNSVPIEGMFDISKLFTIILMFIGAAPGSTGGGIKVTTFLVLISTVICVFRGKDETIIHNRKVDKSVIYKALAVVTAALMAVIVSTATIYFTSKSEGIALSEIDTIFETVSAFGTVGLSSGVTGLVSTGSRLALILTMFIGRVGPVSLALSLALATQNKNTIVPEAKIMVG
ncbi:MAG: potassium transporter TrkG, partial [Oscillospiraceae bacterium]